MITTDEVHKIKLLGFTEGASWVTSELWRQLMELPYDDGVQSALDLVMKMRQAIPAKVEKIKQKVNE